MSILRRVWRHYGSGPLHLLVLLATFALGGYAAWTLIGGRPVAIVIWFAAAVIGHDLVLLPLYVMADRGMIAVSDLRETRVPWVNYVRFPAVISGILLLVFLPSISGVGEGSLMGASGLTTTGYFRTWLAVTGVLFLLSALTYAGALVRAGRRLRRADPAR